MPPRIPLSLPIALQRRIAKAVLHRSSRVAVTVPTSVQARPLHTTFHLAAPRSSTTSLADRYSSPAPAPTALTALLARLSLPPSSSLHATLLACLTHPSYTATSASPTAASSSSSPASSSSADVLPGTDEEVGTNELLATLGNSLLGLFTSEHVAALYPELPTEALKSAITAYVGPRACLSVARELGVAVSSQSSEVVRGKGKTSVDAGVAVRFSRSIAAPSLASASDGSAQAVEGGRKVRKDGWEDIVASVIRAFVGLIYQEQGIHAARSFVESHFLSRHLDMTTLFNFKNPKHVLSGVVAKHLALAGVRPGGEEGRIDSRLLGSTGTFSQAPLFNIGLFLPSGLKLAEGHGSSLAMAEHRAATNALHSLFLVRSDASRPSASVQVPTGAHDVWAISGGSIGKGTRYIGSGGVVAESIVDSSRAGARR